MQYIHVYLTLMSHSLILLPGQEKMVLLINEIHEIHENHKIQVNKNWNPQNPAQKYEVH